MPEDPMTPGTNWVFALAVQEAKTPKLVIALLNKVFEGKKGSEKILQTLLRTLATDEASYLLLLKVVKQHGEEILPKHTSKWLTDPVGAAVSRLTWRLDKPRTE